MSANIPFEIQAEIIKRVLPVKSLIRFRSVSKQWKSLINSSEFITHHSLNQTHSHHLKVRYDEYSESKYVSIVDDDSFPNHKFSHDVSASTVKLVNRVLMLDCSLGLVCVYGECKLVEKHLVVFWNPSIRKSVAVFLHSRANNIGFGVCRKTGDPKIVNIIRTTSMDWNAEVFSLSTGVWRSISMNLHTHLKEISSNPYYYSYQVDIDGVIHWVASKSGNGLCDMILLFNFTSEEFGKIDLPNSLEHEYVSISKLKESLVVFYYLDIKMFFDVWMMIKNGDSKPSFAKLFKFEPFFGLAVYHLVGFRNNGQLIRAREPIGEYPFTTTLEVYEPCTQRSNYIGFEFDDVISQLNFMVTSYTESLLLLNHPNSIIQGFEDDDDSVLWSIHRAKLNRLVGDSRCNFNFMQNM